MSTWLTETPRSMAWARAKPREPDWLTMPMACGARGRRAGMAEKVRPAPVP